MKKEEIINVLQANLIEIIPELEGEEIDLNTPLVDLGANSIDRGELIALTLEQLELEVPRIEFVSANSLMELADLMVQKSLVSQ